MSVRFNGEKVFLHWSLDIKGVQVPEDLGLITVRDVLLPGEPSLEERFLRSRADIAFIDTYPFIFGGSKELLESELMKIRSVCLKMPSAGEKSASFNRQLDDSGFLSILISELSSKPSLAHVFTQALSRVRVTS